MAECYVCEKPIEGGEEIAKMQSEIEAPSDEIEKKHVTVKIEFFDAQSKPIVLCKNCVVTVVTHYMLEYHDAA